MILQGVALLLRVPEGSPDESPGALPLFGGKALVGKGAVAMGGRWPPPCRRLFGRAKRVQT